MGNFSPPLPRSAVKEQRIREVKVITIRVEIGLVEWLNGNMAFLYGGLYRWAC